jgi:hypothetical protein
MDYGKMDAIGVQWEKYHVGVGNYLFVTQGTIDESQH